MMGQLNEEQEKAGAKNADAKTTKTIRNHRRSPLLTEEHQQQGCSKHKTADKGLTLQIGIGKNIFFRNDGQQKAC